ncbi:IS3 family transposase [Streptomyces sp. NPDC013161]|uniref:IS3 family transposase n=1 Tax=Streptomyces sp. NPDC013161 TaxID=3364862 RepID=UPI0036A589BA
MLKDEYVHRHTFTTRSEARIRIATWITDFYNSRRLHSVCGFKRWASLGEGQAA